MVYLYNLIKNYSTEFFFLFRYLNQFNMDLEESINFEKSATYFDSILVLKRIKALLPNIRLISIFTEPGNRAYSRYQVKLNLYFREGINS